MQALGIDDQLVPLQELIDHGDGGVQIPSGVAPQVEDERLHALRLELRHRRLELLVGILRKTVELDVADLLLHHERGVDAVQRDLVAHDLEIDQLGVTAAFHAHGDLGAFLATEMLLHILVVDFLPETVLAVDLDELVPRHDADFLRRTARSGTDDGDGVADQLEGHADALKTAHQRLVGLLYILL